MAASWWDNDKQAGDSSVVRHAPDDNNYHIPDGEMLSKMRGSKVGHFATIPVANKDGTSRGFDPTVAGPVHVDPDAPDGGVIFDPNSVTKKDMRAAISKSYYPHQAFYALGTPATLLGFGRNNIQSSQEETRDNPHLPTNAYLAPKAKNDGTQAYSADNEIPQAQQEVPVNSLQHNLGQAPIMGSQQPQQPQQIPTQQSYFQPLPASQIMPDPNIAVMMQAIMGMQQQINALVQRQQAPAPVTTGLSHVPLPQGPPPGLATIPIEARRNQRNRTRVGQSLYDDDEEFDEVARPIHKRVVRDRDTQEIINEDDDNNRPHKPVKRARRNSNSLVEHDQAEREQTVEEYEEVLEREKPRRGVIAGFETLNISWVTGPVANKAKKQVFFEIPGAGKHSARYHDVIESEHCVTLVYDTRYEDGTQYLPPDLGEEQIKLHCPGIKKTFTVSSMGFSYPFGVFDMIVLVRHETEDLNYDERS